MASEGLVLVQLRLTRDWREEEAFRRGRGRVGTAACIYQIACASQGADVPTGEDWRGT